MEDRAHSIYLNARRYAMASRLLNREAQANQHYLLLPSFVNAALALELYFKALFFLEKARDFRVNGRHSHNFYTLFTELSPPVQHQLRSDFESLMNQRNMEDVNRLEQLSFEIPRDIESNLKSWSRVFVDIRYVYDSKGDSIPMMFFDEIEQAALFAIFKLKPEWKRKP